MNQRIALTVLTALSCGLVQQTFSQINYQPGYVVSLQGDTLKGYIDYRNWGRNPKIVSFKKTPDGEPQEFHPLDIRSFIVSGDLYEGAIVDVETSPEKIQDLYYGSEMHIITDTVFVRALSIGDKSLYMVHYASKSVYKDQFYIRQGARMELLQYRVYKRDHNGATSLATNNFYKRQLALYLEGCATLQSKLKEVEYDSRKLKRLFDAYYVCTQGQVKFVEKKEKYSLEIGVLLGITRTQVSIHSDVATDPSLAGPTFSPDINFTAGFYFDLIKPRNHRKWSFKNELIYTAYKTDRTNHININRSTSTLAYDYYYSRLEYSYFKLNSMIRFKHPIGKMHIFVNAGISNGYMLSGSDYSKRVYKYNHWTEEAVTEGTLFNDSGLKYEFGFLGGLGVRYHRYALEARYDHSNGMLGMSSSVNKTSLLLSCRLTKEK